MDSQIEEHLAVAPLRRDVQALRDSLASLKPGDLARVVVRSTRYGLHVVDGPVRVGAGGQLTLAGVFLTTGSEIQRIYRPATIAAYPADVPEASAANALEHGALARVTFSDLRLGVFQVTGPITAGQDDFLLIGSWIVSHAGVVAPRVVHIEHATDIAMHPANIPPLRSVLVEEPAS